MNNRKEINVLIGANIKKEREKLGLTQDQFSEMIGLGTKSLSAIERGTVGVSLTTLRNICTTLSVSCDSLMFGNRAENDAADLTARLEALSPKRFKIVNDVIGSLLEAFATGKE